MLERISPGSCSDSTIIPLSSNFFNNSEIICCSFVLKLIGFLLQSAQGSDSNSIS